MAPTEKMCLACGEPGKHFRRPTMGKFAHYTCADHPLTPAPPRHVAPVITRRG